MKYNIIRPNIPVIWIDTHAITALSTSYSQPDSSDNIVIANREILDKLRELRRAGNIFVFETDQMREIEVKSKLDDAARTVLAQLTLGVRSSHVNVQDNQTYRAMEAAIGKLNEMDFEFASAFRGDPFAQEQHGSLIIGAHFEPNRVAIRKRLASNREIAKKWEAIRTSTNISIPRTTRRREQWDRELLARQNVFRNAYMSLRAPEDIDTLFAQIDSVSLPLTFWRQRGGNPTPQALFDFYGSDYYTSLPHVEIFSGLAAHKVTGNETIKPSDIADINNISTVMPYCTHMVLDRAMIDAVRKIGFDKKYDVKLLRLNQLMEEFDYI
jgi:hypothetical protein